MVSGVLVVDGKGIGWEKGGEKGGEVWLEVWVITGGRGQDIEILGAWEEVKISILIKIRKNILYDI